MDPEPSLVISFLSLEMSFVWFKGIILFALIISSALISGAEVAFFSLNSAVLNEAEEEELKNISLIRSLLDRPNRLLAIILVANNFINIAIVLLFASLSPLYLGGISNPVVVLFIEIGLITGLILIFGEILPKVYANRNAMGFSQFMAPVLKSLDRYLLFFLTSPMSRLTLWFEKRAKQSKNDFSVDQLSQVLELSTEEKRSKQEEKMLQGIIQFGNTEVKEVMCPRVDMFTLSEKISFLEIIPLIVDKGFSRIPVYKDEQEKISGILYIKDLLPHLGDKHFKWQNLLREPYYVPEYKKLDDLLSEFQQRKTHLAVVLDEYGGTQGIITLEDVIEEIVGDISDEFDEDNLFYSKLDSQNYIFDAKTNLKDFLKIVQLRDEEGFEKVKGEAETLAGFLLELSQSLPKIGQKLTFENLVFTVESVDQKRIRQIKVTLPKTK
ncbi:MAG TPA: gliding motility-associated protein GldE [Flavobacteriaceae bacterium]|mgnify:CR=1 FL=1|nr:gliding motility-associated protein GldE [Flavobacteriaceae bacterium]